MAVSHYVAQVNLRSVDPKSLLEAATTARSNSYCYKAKTQCSRRESRYWYCFAASASHCSNVLERLLRRWDYVWSQRICVYRDASFERSVDVSCTSVVVQW